jgi:hypothetical protein
MPDEDDKTSADEETLPKTSLHAYKDGREEDVEGDVEKLKEGDRDEMQVPELESDSEDPGLAHEKK